MIATSCVQSVAIMWCPDLCESFICLARVARVETPKPNSREVYQVESQNPTYESVPAMWECVSQNPKPNLFLWLPTEFAYVTCVLEAVTKAGSCGHKPKQDDP